MPFDREPALGVSGAGGEFSGESAMMESLFFSERFLNGGETFSPVILDSSALRYKQKQSKLRTWRYSEDLVKRREKIVGKRGILMVSLFGFGEMASKEEKRLRNYN